MMKKLKRSLISTLKNDLHVNPKKIDSNQSFAEYLTVSPLEFNLMLYYIENKLNIEIDDNQVNINQNIDQFVQALYLIVAGYKNK